jgi:hypothetical protein
VVLLNDVVEVLALAQLNVKAGVLIDAVDSGPVGAAFVNGDLLRQTLENWVRLHSKGQLMGASDKPVSPEHKELRGYGDQALAEVLAHARAY